MKKLFLELSKPVLSLPRVFKRICALSIDAMSCVLTVWLAYYLRLGEFVPLTEYSLAPVFFSVCIALPVFIILGLYRAIFRYSGWPALTAVGRAIVIYASIYALIFTVIGVKDVPRTIGIIQPILLLIFVGGSRTFVRLWLGDSYQKILNKASRPKALIYGAGKSGRQLAAAMANNFDMHVVGFLDDNNSLQGHVLNGLRIYNPDELIKLVPSLCIKDVLLAMPTIPRKRRNEILNKIRLAHVSVRTLPSFTDLAQGKVSVNDIKELDIDDLLGRQQIEPNFTLLCKNVAKKTVLVTGAGGSIGSELCRQILRLEPKKLLLVEQSEFSLYSIHEELRELMLAARTEIIPLIASVQDAQRMNDIMATWKPETVYHAAAYKHVPLVENNPAEGIKNNIFGTLTAALAAAENGVNDFVLISTDKAVRPTNVMGATKQFSEKILQALSAENTKTKFTMVRFGNVLGSSGSVVPKFKMQISTGNPITLTHSDITRYFMTIPEAAQLVIQAGAMANGGDVFVLDMGEPVRIIDLASRMIELSGLTIKDKNNPDGDIEIQITGLRPGEKLYEELLVGDNPEKTEHPRIMKAHESFIKWSTLELIINELRISLSENSIAHQIKALEKVVTGYEPQRDCVDYCYLEKTVMNHFTD